MILVHFQGKPVKITVIQVYAPPTDVEEAEQFYEDLLELTQKRMSFLSQGIGMKKIGSQEIPEVTGKFDLEYKMKQGKD